MGVQVPVDPVFAVQEAVEAFERDELPRRPVLSLLMSALRKCMDGEDSLWVALGVPSVGPGGRHKRPSERLRRAREAAALNSAAAQMPGDSPKERFENLERRLLAAQREDGAVSVDPGQQEMINNLMELGLAGLPVRTLRNRAKRG